MVPHCLRIPAAATAAVLLAAAVVAPGAPFAPGTTIVPEPILSLEGIERLQLVVEGLPQPLARAGLTEMLLATRARHLLTEAGLRIDESAEGSLRIQCHAMTEEKLPGGVAYVVSVRFHQPAHLPRLDRTLTLPTYDHVGGGLETEQDLREAALDTVTAMVRRFAEGIKEAARSAPE